MATDRHGLGPQRADRLEARRAIDRVRAGAHHAERLAQAIILERVDAGLAAGNGEAVGSSVAEAAINHQLRRDGEHLDAGLLRGLCFFQCGDPQHGELALAS